MGMFTDLMTKIFHADANAERPSDAARPGVPPQSRFNTAPGTTATPAANTSSSAGSSVDVAANLDKLAGSQGEKLDWRHSIVDMMKLVGMDSSLAARKGLAADLHYSGDMNDSATMNIWLHKEVMKKLAENGGKVPAELLSH
jgi:hypothetical protein